MQNEFPSFPMLWTWEKNTRLRRLGISLIRDICSYLPSTCSWVACVMAKKIVCCDFKDKLVTSDAALSKSVFVTGVRWSTIDSNRVVLCGGSYRKA